MMARFYQIAMDGPAGAGKSSIAKKLSLKLNFTFINSGGIFRSIAVAIAENNIDYNNENQIENLLKLNKISQKGDDMYLNDKNISDKTWTPKITALVPNIAKIKIIREYVKKIQQNIAKTNNIAIEGRDTTTMIFPNAILKCWVFADPKIRALRRWEQNGKIGTVEEILDELLLRDKKDSERVEAPMKRAFGAFDVDTTNLNVDQAVTLIFNEFLKRKK
ncbi:MAG: (d)CMP kinase [Mycoplasmataceae bacterium]|nr:(d)CMP kinase [Mycoplasmataceae bacterium]